MSEKIAIIYREFYDVPRMIITKYKEHVFLLESLFDEAADEYPDCYTVYLLPELTDDELNGSWKHIDQKAISQLCKIPVKKVVFDETKRKTIDSSLLEEIGRQYGLW